MGPSVRETRKIGFARERIPFVTTRPAVGMTFDWMRGQEGVGSNCPICPMCQGGCQGAEAKRFGYRWRIRGWWCAPPPMPVAARCSSRLWASEDGRPSSEVHRFFGRRGASSAPVGRYQGTGGIALWPTLMRTSTQTPCLMFLSGLCLYRAPLSWPERPGAGVDARSKDPPDLTSRRWIS